jgi:N-acetylneuraminic acid mutarotase
LYVQAPAISTKRAAHVCEVLNDQIYIMGGYGSASDAASSFLSTTEVYDPRANAWREGPDMGLPRAYGNSGVVDGFLYVLCGMNAVCAPYQLHTCFCVWKCADSCNQAL